MNTDHNGKWIKDLRLNRESTDTRTHDEKIADIRRHGNYSSPARLRKLVMESLSIPAPKISADYALVFGCYAPYSNHRRLLRTYVKTLEHLDVDYTCLENEYCCGSPLLQTCKGADRNRAKEAVRDFLQLNVEQAIQKKVHTMAYFCSSCARIANSMSKDDGVEHIYLLDVILDHLGDHRLRYGPAVAGYFEGCHATIDAHFTGATLPWKRYREVLGEIHGLQIVDLPGDVCCRGQSESILEKGVERNLPAVICSCNNCVRHLERNTGDTIRVKHMVEIISTALGVTGESVP